MSHSERYKDTGRTSVFYDGAQYGTHKERERILRLLGGYSFKDVNGGVILNRDGVAACMVTDKVLVHSDNDAWREFQQIATLVMAQLIKGEQK